ncbi:hypothetical protein WICPIJ_002892 [Wickerhamomyces pijperi]|uniref:Zn(2)-C6 fungal-type domain-containing protein n=1 Tax=Wickerhamomyces pijperi TaxID=599730 RepID=A0A9P8Q8Q6_WICPI|nr:hypothetical protein WICPIJ_002892 [Wickerhamomyces pijperi]
MSSIQKAQSSKQKKLLKSCIRCRKHKTKCDSYLRSPGPCSNCLKKNHICKIEFISPPKRFDNLKNLNNNLVDIHTKIEEMLEFYETMRIQLNITDLKSYQEFKDENYHCFASADNSDYMSDYNSDYDAENDDYSPPPSIHDSCLLKLSNSKFVNITLTSTTIKVNEFEHSLADSESLIDQHYKNLFNIFDILSSSYGPGPGDSADSLMEDEDLLSPLEAFKENKLLFTIIAMSDKHNETEIHLINQFLKDYVNSYYSIIQREKLNTDLMSSTALSSNVYSARSPSDSVVFGKPELCNFLNLKFFNNDRFLIKLIKTLVIKFFINSEDIDDNKFLIIKLLKIIELKLNLNRKNFNFEKNLSTSWKVMLRFIIDLYYKTFNLHLVNNFKIHQNKEDENLQNLLVNYKIETTHIFQNLSKLTFNCPDLTHYLNSHSTAMSSPASDSSNRSIESTHSTSTNFTAPESDANVCDSSSYGVLPASSQPDISRLQNYFKSQAHPEPEIILDEQLVTNAKVDEKPQTGEYEVILDRLIDWQKDSADDVLMKINQLIKS